MKDQIDIVFEKFESDMRSLTYAEIADLRNALAEARQIKADNEAAEFWTRNMEELGERCDVVFRTRDGMECLQRTTRHLLNGRPIRLLQVQCRDEKPEILDSAEACSYKAREVRSYEFRGYRRARRQAVAIYQEVKQT